eukprot:m.3756 g.3756  ORF g.3756 m.3756 type:complete len:1059 (+) comp9775_c0_seq1:48-3224(+)
MDGSDSVCSFYDALVDSTTFEEVTEVFKNFTTTLKIDTNAPCLSIHKEIKANVNSWKCTSLWTLLDKRAAQREFEKGTAASKHTVLIVGAGPAGLRAAIDCAFLGADVHVVEKRTSFSRNNVLHLWTFVIEDLKALGIKKFFGKFCSGAIDHINIRTLQLSLLKIALLLGVKVHGGVEFVSHIPPQSANQGWTAEFKSTSEAASQLAKLEFDVLVGADGRRNTIPGFERQEFRGKLALAITANFRNRKTREEAAVNEISGVAYIYNQKFFQDLKSTSGVDLENIVYYKDDTHYFVMTARKESLLAKGVIKKDFSTDNMDRLLGKENIDLEALCSYAREAADFSTELPQLDMEINNRGQPDIALFDFTSIYASANAARIEESYGRRLLVTLVGDGLIEPFWPTGSGCARAFLSALDAVWMIKGFCKERPPLELLAERETVYRLLPQTSPARLCEKFSLHTINPTTRYPELKSLQTVPLRNVRNLYVDGEGQIMDVEIEAQSKKRKDKDKFKAKLPAKKLKEKEEVQEEKIQKPADERRRSSSRAVWHPDEDVLAVQDTATLLSWIQSELADYPEVKVTDLGSSWSNGLAFCALIHRYHPHLIDFECVKRTKNNGQINNKLAFSVAARHFQIPSMLNPDEMRRPDRLSLIAYVSRLFDFLQGKDPVPREKEKEKKAAPAKKDDKTNDVLSGARAKLRRVDGIGNRTKSGRWLFAESSSPEESPLTSKEPTPVPEVPVKQQLPKPSRPDRQLSSSEVCCFCAKRVYVMERLSAEGLFFHRQCFKCSHCATPLKLGNYAYSRGIDGQPGKFFCKPHYRQLFLSNPDVVGYGRAAAKRGQSYAHRIPASSVASGGDEGGDEGQREAEKRIARQRQLRRLRAAQEIQREMGMLEVQMVELERKSVQVERRLRKGIDEEKHLRRWYSLINEKNGLVRRDQELMILFKDLQLIDRREQLDSEIRAIESIPGKEKTKEDDEEIERLTRELCDVVEERNELVLQTEEARLSEIEEDRIIEETLTKKSLLETDSGACASNVVKREVPGRKDQGLETKSDVMSKFFVRKL